ncbi:MAG TPA: hypothetical protein VFB00_10535, partial [Terriglobales bacterium]|nr:hypothetical protein [Terriglobales bacterium]
WNREVRGQTRIGGVPTLAERGGDFSNTRGGTCDPSVSPAYSNGTNTGIPTFTGNVIPAANLSPAGLIFLANFPLPNLATPVGCSNWAQSFGDIDNWREDNVRSDFHITKTTSLMFRYTRDTWDQPFPSTLQYWGEDIWPNVEDHWAQPSSQATVKLTKLLGSSAVNDFQISFAANAINVARVGTGAPAGSYYSSPGTLGAALTANELNGANVAASPTYFPASLKAYKPGTSPTSLGQQGFWGNGPVGISCASPVCGTFGDEGPWHNNEQLLILKDDFSKVFRGHTFKAGFLATNNQKNQRLQNESLGENAQYWSTTADGWGGPPSSGNGVFDILNIGTQWGFSENSTNLFELMRWHDYEFYVGDNWKVRRNFTVDYGVRWSFLRNAYDANGNFGWFEPNLFNPSLGGSPCNGMLLTKHGLDTCATIGLAGGTLGHDTGLVPNNNHLIQPRIGIAWDVRGDGKTAIRAGFGTFYNRFMLNTAMAAPSNPPYVFTNPSSASQRSLDPQFAPVFPCASLCAAGLMGDKPGIGILQNDRIPEAIQYNLTVERELAPNTKLEIAYVGNQGRFLESFVNANMPITPAGRLAYAESSFGGNQNQNLTPFGAATGGAWGAIQFGGFNGVSHYDSLQALFRTRIKVVDAQFAYTWSKSLANTDISDSSGSRQQPNTYNAGDPRSFYGPSIINRPHIFVSSIVYNAPKLEGQNAFLRAVLGAWETSAILQYQSGPSLTVYSNTGNDLLGDGYANSNRPNLVTGQSCKPGNSAQNQWFNPAKFTMDKYVLGTLPTSGRGVCPGPGTANTDFSVRKNFKITERVNAKFSMDFFNLFNKTQFRADSVNVNLSNGGGLTACNFTVNTGASTACPGYPNDSVAWNPATSLNANFGQATNDRGPRQIQYGLKIEF